MYKQNLKGTIKHTANCAYYNYQIIFVHKIIYLTLSTYLDTLYITKLIVSTTKHLTLYITNYTVQTVLNTMIYKCNNFRNKKKKQNSNNTEFTHMRCSTFGQIPNELSSLLSREGALPLWENTRTSRRESALIARER